VVILGKISLGGIPLRLRLAKWLWVLSCFGVVALVFTAYPSFAQTFRNAPASAEEMKNPYQGNAQAAAGGKKHYVQNCAQCHGNDLQGMGPAPALTSAKVKSAPAGDLFWFITNGDLNKGMPGWPQLPKQQRWQIVTFLELKNGAQ
jgi:mono/diheme cytochrome c family protein